MALYWQTNALLCGVALYWQTKALLCGIALLRADRDERTLWSRGVQQYATTNANNNSAVCSELQKVMFAYLLKQDKDSSVLKHLQHYYHKILKNNSVLKPKNCALRHCSGSKTLPVTWMKNRNKIFVMQQFCTCCMNCNPKWSKSSLNSWLYVFDFLTT